MNDRLPPPPADVRRSAPSTAARSLGTPDDFRRGYSAQASPEPAPSSGGETAQAQPSGPKKQATETIAARAGALSDEIDFPAFVASLIHGTFDAIVDSSIKQMESFAELVAAVAKPLDQFAQENVTSGQARGWLVEQFPRDVTLVEEGGEYKLMPIA